MRHHLLWQKLSCIEVTTKLLNLLINTYAKLHSTGRGHYGSFRCDISVQQGCPSSSILFTLFTCDLLDALKGCSGVILASHRIPVLMFANDLVLLADI